MKFYQTSSRTITVESYVTLRSQWPQEMGRMVAMEYNARGHRVVDGNMEWQYFTDEIDAKKWSDAAHSSPNANSSDAHTAAAKLEANRHDLSTLTPEERAALSQP